MKKFIFWGSGKFTEELMELIDMYVPKLMDNIVCIVEKNPAMLGTAIKGKEIVAPNKLNSKHSYEEAEIIICSNSYEVIKKTITESYSPYHAKSYIDFYFEYVKPALLEALDSIQDQHFKDWLHERKCTLVKELEDELGVLDELSLKHLDYHYNYLLFTQLYTIYNLKKSNYKNLYQETVVINGKFPYHMSEVSLAYIMANNGVQVHHFNEDLTINEYVKAFDVIRESNQRNIKKLPHLVRKKLFPILYQHPNICFYQYSDLNIDKTILENVSTIKHAKSNTKRQLKTDLIDLVDVNTNEIFTDRLKLATASWYLGEYIHTHIAPTIFITSHAIYSPHGPCFDYLKEVGYTCIVCDDNGHLPDVFTIENNICNVLANRGQSILRSMSLPLTEEKIKAVDSYMDKRLNLHAHDNARLYANKSAFDEAEYLEKLKRFKGNDKLFCLFPNIVWDGAEEERNTAFDSVINWVVETIEYFEKGNVGKLLVRFHPAESAFGWYIVGKPLMEFINERLPDWKSYKNVLFIESNVPFNSYLLKDELMDVGIMYSGTVGFEFPYVGKPVISAGDGRCSYYGVNYVVKDKHDYFDTIAKLAKDKISIVTFKESIYKFIHWYLFDLTYYYPFTDGVFGTVFKEVNYELDLEKNNKLKLTIDRLLNKNY